MGNGPSAFRQTDRQTGHVRVKNRGHVANSLSLFDPVVRPLVARPPAARSLAREVGGIADGCCRGGGGAQGGALVCLRTDDPPRAQEDQPAWESETIPVVATVRGS